MVSQQEWDGMKQKVDSAVTSLWELKVEVQKVKKLYVVIAAVCVGVALGCIMTNIWKYGIEVICNCSSMCMCWMN